MPGTIHKADGTILHLVDTAGEATTVIAAKKADTKTATQWGDAVYTDTILPPAGAHHPDYHVRSGAVVERKPTSELVPLCEAALVSLRDYLEGIRERARMNLGWSAQKNVHASLAKYYTAFYRISKREFAAASNPTAQTEYMKTYWSTIPKGPGITADAFMRAIDGDNWQKSMDGVVYADPRNGEQIEPANVETVSRSLLLHNPHSGSDVTDTSVASGEWISGVV